jgi:hypothetical protein
MIMFACEVGAPAVLCDGSETSVARGRVVGSDDARGIDLYVEFELLVLAEYLSCVHWRTCDIVSVVSCGQCVELCYLHWTHQG